MKTVSYVTKEAPCFLRPVDPKPYWGLNSQICPSKPLKMHSFNLLLSTSHCCSSHMWHWECAFWGFHHMKRCNLLTTRHGQGLRHTGKMHKIFLEGKAGWNKTGSYEIERGKIQNDVSNSLSDLWAAPAATGSNLVGRQSSPQISAFQPKPKLLIPETDWCVINHLSRHIIPTNVIVLKQLFSQVD